MIKDSTWGLFWVGATVLVAVPAPSGAQVVQSRTIEFPGGGTRNNGTSIGPFCCEGETAIIHDTDGKPAGYLYFYDFDGAMNVGADKSVAATISVLISSGKPQSIVSSARFIAESWAPGTVAGVEIGPVHYNVTIDPQLSTINGHKYFDMGSMKATVRVASDGVAPPTTPQHSPGLDQALTQYRAFLAGVAAWYEQHPDTMGLSQPPAESIRFNPGIEPYEVDVVPDDAPDTAQDGQLLLLARKTGMLRAQLRAARYPPDLYEGLVQQYEVEFVRTALGEIPAAGGDRLKALVESIEQARLARQPELSALRYVVFMGMMNPIPTIFRTSQPGGQVWLITQLRFEVCRAQFPDPYDREKCRKWKPADPQNPMRLSGTYVYQVNWNGGGNARGMRSVELMDGASAPVIYTVP